MRIKPSSRLTSWWSAIQHRRRERAENLRRHGAEARFESLIETAHEIARINPYGLVELIRALLRPMQSEYLLGVAELGRDPFPTIGSQSFFGGAVASRLYSADGMRFRGRKLDARRFTLRLARDPVLPWAWNRTSYMSALATIGSHDGQYGKKRWRQDFNHKVDLWLPWGIGFVAGGNHSITAGILAADGELVPCNAYDMCFLFDELRCDGTRFHDQRTGRSLVSAIDTRRAAVFEIGRIMHEHGISAFDMAGVRIDGDDAPGCT